RPDRHRARSGAEIEHLLTPLQRRPPDYTVDDLPEPVIDLAQIDRRHAIPYTHLPLRCRLLVVAARHDDPPSVAHPYLLTSSALGPRAEGRRSGRLPCRQYCAGYRSRQGSPHRSWYTKSASGARATGPNRPI